MLLCLLAVLPLPSRADGDSLVISLVLSDRSMPYQQFSQSLGKTLAASNADVNIITPPTPNGVKTGLIIAVGMRAAEFAITNSDAPVLAVMIPKTGYEMLLEKQAAQNRTRATSAIYLNQPWERQLDFILAALPGYGRLGLLYPPDTYTDIAGLRQRVSERGLSLDARPVRFAEMLFPALDEMLDDVDLLLAIPDSAIYNSNNVRNILLTSYWHKVPLVGISQAYVSAGAICAIFSTPEQLAVQAAGVAVSFARNRQLPAPQYPASFSIAINQQVARSLGVVLDTPEAIRERMNKAGGGER